MVIDQLSLWGAQADGGDACDLASGSRREVRRRAAASAISARESGARKAYKDLKTLALGAPLFASTRSASVPYRMLRFGEDYVCTIERKVRQLEIEQPRTPRAELARQALSENYQVARQLEHLGNPGPRRVLEKRLLFESTFGFSWRATYTALRFIRRGCDHYGQITLVFDRERKRDLWPRMTIFAGDSAVSILDADTGLLGKSQAETREQLCYLQDRFATFEERHCATVGHAFDAVLDKSSRSLMQIHKLHDRGYLIEVHVHGPAPRRGLAAIEFDEPYVRQRHDEYTRLRYFPGDSRRPPELLNEASSVDAGMDELFFYDWLIRNAPRFGGRHVPEGGRIEFPD